MRPTGTRHAAGHPQGRNPGDVWDLPTRPYRDRLVSDPRPSTWFIGHENKLRWNSDDECVWSEHPVNDPLVSHEDFERARILLGSRGRTPGGEYKVRRTAIATCFVVQSSAACVTGRMRGRHSNGEAYYRCRFPEEYALANRVHYPRNVFLRERDVVGPIDAWIATEFASGRLAATLDDLAAAHADEDTSRGREAARLKGTIDECDRNRRRTAPPWKLGPIPLTEPRSTRGSGYACAASPQKTLCEPR